MCFARQATNGEKPPVASRPEDITPDEYPDGSVNLLLLDMDSYAEKYGSKAVRKNCTIPVWLNTAAEQANINFSAVLQSALKGSSTSNNTKQTCRRPC